MDFRDEVVTNKNVINIVNKVNDYYVQLKNIVEKVK
jgi:hypothetical protein